MASKPHRITEADVGIAVLQVLAERDSGEATVRHLKRRLPEFVKLSPSDREDSETRTNEELWEQQVRTFAPTRTPLAIRFTRGSSTVSCVAGGVSLRRAYST